VTDTLDQLQIPFIPVEACIFVYCDFSSLLRVQSFEGEAEFATLVEDHAKIVMTPGSSQRDNKPGFFRICYAWVTPAVLTIAMKRLSALSESLREFGWENVMQNIDDGNNFIVDNEYEEKCLSLKNCLRLK